MRLPWFRRVGVLFIPTKVWGVVILLAGIAYSVYIFVDIDSKSHSVSDTLINFAFNELIVLAVYSFVAYLTSKQQDAEP